MSRHIIQRPSGLVVSTDSDAELYRGTHGKDYEPPNRRGFICIPVLEFLNGLPWDDFALSWAHALRPSMIRVTDGEETTDAVCWRVTVYVGKDGRIRSVRQEVEVGLRGPYQHGHALDQELDQRRGLA